MSKTKEIVIAFTFLLALALLYIGINFLKGKNLFSKNNVYYACYTDVTGLSNTTPIYTNGVRIGIVDGISYNYNKPDNIVVRLKINKDLRIPSGSVAVLETELLGSVNMNLILADNKNHFLTPGDTLQGNIDKGTLSQISAMMPKITALIPRLDSILLSINALTSDSSLVRSLHNAESLTANANRTINQISSLTAPAGNLISKLNSVSSDLDSITKQLSQATNAVDLKVLVEQLDGTIKNLNKVSSELNSKEGTAGLLLSDPTLYEKLNKVCTDAETLINDIREHPSHYIKFWKK